MARTKIGHSKVSSSPTRKSRMPPAKIFNDTVMSSYHQYCSLPKMIRELLSFTQFMGVPRADEDNLVATSSDQWQRRKEESRVQESGMDRELSFRGNIPLHKNVLVPSSSDEWDKNLCDGFVRHVDSTQGDIRTALDNELSSPSVQGISQEATDLEVSNSDFHDSSEVPLHQLEVSMSTLVQDGANGLSHEGIQNSGTNDALNVENSYHDDSDFIDQTLESSPVCSLSSTGP